MPHVDPPRRRVRDVVGDAALLVLADGERAVVGPRHPRVVLVLCGADVYQSSVERRQARVADVIPVRMESLRWLNPTRPRPPRHRRPAWQYVVTAGLCTTSTAAATTSATMKRLQVIRVAAFITVGPGLTDSLVSLVTLVL